jgi:hypothetical protein
MNLREALIQQAPSLALQRAAADEIARLDAQVGQLVTGLRTLAAQSSDNPASTSRADCMAAWAQAALNAAGVRDA